MTLPRFLTAGDIARDLQISLPQAYRIVKEIEHATPKCVGQREYFDWLDARTITPREAANDIPEQWVYAIQVDSNGPIKIGTARNPRSRRSTLQIASPWQLRLLGAWAGDENDEITLHRLLREHRIRGEWFHPTADVIELVAWCMATGKSPRR